MTPRLIGSSVAASSYEAAQDGCRTGLCRKRRISYEEMLDVSCGKESDDGLGGALALNPQEWLVDAVLDHRINNTLHESLVQWSDRQYPASWWPADNLQGAMR